MGAPGSGKGTQAALIVKELDLDHISTGDLLRAAVAAATEKMTGAAGITAGFIDILCDILQVYSIFWMTGFTRRFAVCARTVMAYQAVNIFFGGKIEALVLPAITYMAGRAVGKIRLRRDTEIIQDIALAKPLLVVGIKKLPGPVVGFMDLFGRLGVAFDAGPGDFRTGLEILLKLLEPGVISG